jgi:hypothetical protein
MLMSPRVRASWAQQRKQNPWGQRAPSFSSQVQLQGCAKIQSQESIAQCGQADSLVIAGSYASYFAFVAGCVLSGRE